MDVEIRKVEDVEIRKVEDVDASFENRVSYRGRTGRGQRSPTGAEREQSNGQTKQITGFEVFIRDRDFDDFLKKSSLNNSKKPHKMRGSGVGSTSPMGVPVPSLTPSQTKAGTGAVSYRSCFC